MDQRKFLVGEILCLIDQKINVLKDFLPNKNVVPKRNDAVCLIFFWFRTKNFISKNNLVGFVGGLREGAEGVGIRRRGGGGVEGRRCVILQKGIKF